MGIVFSDTRQVLSKVPGGDAYQIFGDAKLQ